MGRRLMAARTTGMLIPIFVAAMLLVSACGGSRPPAASGGRGAAPANAPAAAATPKKGGTITVGMSKDIQVLNPLVRTISTDQVVRQLAFESVLSIDEQGNVQPRLAEKWTTAPDGKGYTFTLKKGVK